MPLKKRRASAMDMAAISGNGRPATKTWRAAWFSRLPLQSMQARVPLPVETRDLESALKGARPTTAEWMQTARSYALHANEAGTYDDVLAYLERR